MKKLILGLLIIVLMSVPAPIWSDGRSIAEAVFAPVLEQIVIIIGSGRRPLPTKPTGPGDPGGGGGGEGDLTPDHTAVSCGRDDVEDLFGLLDEGEVGLIPSCPSGVNWTTELEVTVPANVTVIGAGSLSTLGGGDETVIINMTTNTNLPMLKIIFPATGVFRFAGLTIRDGPLTGGRTVDNAYKNHAVLAFENSESATADGEVRLDHFHFDGHVTLINTHPIAFYNRLFGVADHNIFDFYSSGALMFYNGYYGATDYGSQIWTEEAQFGTSRFMFVENNIFNAHPDGSAIRLGDSNGGAKVVFRFNTLHGSGGLEMHNIGHTILGDRGPRASEGYGNHYTVEAGLANPPQTMSDGSSGGALYWGNVSDNDNVKNTNQIQQNRANDMTYVMLSTPDGWGYCTGTPKSGVIDVAANGLDVTRVSGDNFDTGWDTRHTLTIAGALCDAGGAHNPSSSCRISSTASTTALTLANASSTGALNDVAWNLGSGWDGNTDIVGYPCIDQAGRGQGQLMSGTTEPPTLVNDVTGIISHLNQEPEPMYYWNQTHVPNAGYGGVEFAINTNVGGRVVAGRDYFPNASGIQTNATTPFNGSQSVTGWGTLANRPTSCTFNETTGVGPGYFATDQGSWNTTTSNSRGVNFFGADGLLYKCTADNTWTLYYTPYTFPHPLTEGDVTADHIAASCSRADVNTMLGLIDAGEVGKIPPGTCNWTTGITWTAPANATIIGSGSLFTVGGGDVTVLVDDLTTNNRILAIGSSGGLRLAGFTIQGGTADIKDNGVFEVSGGSVRLDHIHLNTKTYTGSGSAGQSKILQVYAKPVLLDHSVIDLYQNSALYVMNNQGASFQGNESWAADTNFGDGDDGDSWFYIEDNEFIGGADSFGSRVLDCFNTASKVVLRFNTLRYVHGPETHATGSSGDNRGCRAIENYNNHYTTLPSQTSVGYDMHDASSGTHLVWGNTSDDIARGIIFHVTRSNSVTYPLTPPPDNWGAAGPAPRRTGVVNVAANGLDVTWVSGDQFHTDWDSITDPMIYIVDAVCEAMSGQQPADGPTCKIATVNSATSITLASTAGGALTGKTYIVGSNWDGNTNASGYPAIDQPGRGKGDLLVGSFPTKTNQTTGTIAWPNQALEPVYVWKNIGTFSIGFYIADTERIVTNRDYYEQTSGIQTTSSSPFDGTVKTGWGTLANRPTTCTTGVGYFATDQGSWNTTSSNALGVQQNGADGLFYKCTATNTWTLHYTPLVYPHSLSTP